MGRGWRAQVDEIDWLYVHGLGIGQAAPGSRATRFNGAPVRERRPFAASPGLAWVSLGWADAHGTGSGLLLNEQGVLSSIGDWVAGRHNSVQVATVDPARLDDAVFIVRSMLAVDPGPSDGTARPAALREWAIARWSANGVEGAGIHFRGWDAATEAEVQHRLIEHAGMELLLWCSKGERLVGEVAAQDRPYDASSGTPLHVGEPLSERDVTVPGTARVRGPLADHWTDEDQLHMPLGW